MSNVLADSVDLIIDLGTVSEDAFALDSLRNPSGIGRLDREVIPPQVWSNNDDTGLWNSGCEADPGVITYPLADVRANCTRMNGLEDTEDLNQNSVLDTDERFFRYTIDIGNPNSRYFVRNANSFAGLQFKLFRVPLLVPDHRERVTDAEFQNIKHMRFTWVTRGNVLAVLARTRFLGSRFLKRGEAGIVAGLADTVSASPPAGTSVGPISTLDDRYVSPPGITDQGASISDEFALDQQQINEQSLSIAFAELPPDSRAEVYLQYVQTPRNLLEYRRLRVWAMGIDGPWGLEGSPLRFLVKLGEDATNYYLYKTPLRQIPPDAVDEELRQLWLPEVRIDLNRFIALRTRAEQIFFQQQLPEDSALQVWDVDVFEDGDSTYAVFISQRSRPPNLAAVRQISLGVYNGGTTSVPLGRLWVDDIRLDAAEDQMGVVGMVNLDLRASDILSFNLSYSSENPYFRQLAANPSFVSSDQLRVGGRLEFGRFLPNAWGIRMPINVRYSNAESKPTLLPSTDVFTEGLDGLRSPSSKDLRLDMSLSRQARTNVAGIGWLVDNSALRFTLNDRNWRTSRSTSESSNFTAGYSFRSGVSDLSFPIFKPFIFLPRSIRDSRFRITPQRLQFGASYLDSETLTRRFQDIVQLPSDSAAVPIRTLYLSTL